MFVQVIQGRTDDADGIVRQMERWDADVRPGAAGFLGTTGGVADDGTVVLLARFESEDAARANSDRPEQGAWWEETAKYLDGEVTFVDSTDVETFLAGGSNDAGFVQIMQGRARDRDRLAAMEAEMMPRMAEQRPDVIGSVRVWDGDRFVEAIYFTSEAEARKGEAAMEQQSDEMAEFEDLVTDLTFVDLKNPLLR